MDGLVERIEQWITEKRYLRGHQTGELLREAADEIKRLRAAATVPEGYVRVGMEDRRLLGTLPMTADGCVVGDEATVWIDLPEKTWYRGKADANMIVWQTDGPAACVDIWDCYSTREAAEAARKKGGER